MLDGLSLDQLRTFIAATENGSFSAAGRRLERAQSVVSQTLAKLELQIGVKLFDRSSRYPRLTDNGLALLNAAREVVDGVDSFKARARTIREGLEPELSVVIDVAYPMASLSRAVSRFQTTYPNTPLRLYVQALGGVIDLVQNGRCRIGVVGTLPSIPKEVQSAPLLLVKFVSVVAPTHPLSKYRGVIPKREISRHVQLVITDPTHLSRGTDFGVLSTSTWRLGDMGAKHAFLREGFGWGQMPLHLVEEDIRNRRLKKIQIEGIPPETQVLPMLAVHRKDTPPGPAGASLIEWLAHPVSVSAKTRRAKAHAA